MEKDDFESLVIDKLINIENRITTIETTMTWAKFIGRASIIVVLGFFGVDATGMI